MDSCPGGGAEIFEKRVRDVICKNKITGEEWLAIARECHRQGVRTNATMLYGHVETVEDRVDHLMRLRELQDETSRDPGPDPPRVPPGEHAARRTSRRPRASSTCGSSPSRACCSTTSRTSRRTGSRSERKLAQVALHFGADDLVGTVVDETITHAAGAKTASGMTRQEFERIIRESGREPVERDSEYRRVVREPAEAAAAPA